MKAYYIGIKSSSTWDIAWAKGLTKAEVAKKVFEGWHTNKIKFADVECKRVPEIDNMENEPRDLTYKTLVEKCDWFSRKWSCVMSEIKSDYYKNNGHDLF